MMIRIFLLATLAALAGCADREQVAQGERSYQGKPDTHAWAGGSHAAWEKEINRRALAQNEYTRINGGINGGS
jgi:hypothetical protein